MKHIATIAITTTIGPPSGPSMFGPPTVDPRARDGTPATAVAADGAEPSPKRARWRAGVLRAHTCCVTGCRRCVWQGWKTNGTGCFTLEQALPNLLRDALYRPPGGQAGRGRASTSSCGTWRSNRCRATRGRPQWRPRSRATWTSRTRRTSLTGRPPLRPPCGAPSTERHRHLQHLRIQQRRRRSTMCSVASKREEAVPRARRVARGAREKQRAA